MKSGQFPDRRGLDETAEFILGHVAAADRPLGTSARLRTGSAPPAVRPTFPAKKPTTPPSTPPMAAIGQFAAWALATLKAMLVASEVCPSRDDRPE